MMVQVNLKPDVFEKGLKAMKKRESWSDLVERLIEESGSEFGDEE